MISWQYDTTWCSIRRGKKGKARVNNTKVGLGFVEIESTRKNYDEGRRSPETRTEWMAWRKVTTPISQWRHFPQQRRRIMLIAERLLIPIFIILLNLQKNENRHHDNFCSSESSKAMNLAKEFPTVPTFLCNGPTNTYYGNTILLMRKDLSSSFLIVSDRIATYRDDDSGRTEWNAWDRRYCLDALRDV